MSVTITVPPGELVDKLTILEIKSSKIKDKDKLGMVKKELKQMNIALSLLLKSHKKKSQASRKLKAKLYKINLKLWNIENVIRALENKKDFGKRFVESARSVYITNDERSLVKNEINKLFGSTLSEVKQYSKYKTQKYK